MSIPVHKPVVVTSAVTLYMSSEEKVFLSHKTIIQEMEMLEIISVLN